MQGDPRPGPTGKYGNWYFKNEFYFEEFLNLKQENLTVDEYTCLFRELQDICELEEDEIHDLVRYVRGLRPNILEKMNFCKTSQEAYLEAFRVEHMLRQSHMRQCKPEERRSQRPRAHVVERLFAGEENPTLVSRRLLNTNKKEEEEWRLAQKFHTRVRIKDKSVNVIIDNGSAMNFVSQEVIDKLNLPTEKLPKPYQLTWSNGHIIPVTHRCLVSFKIGDYEDEIWCDVIHMNITHIIFGRPWLFDRKVYNDKVANTYTLSWNGKGIRLISLDSTAPSSSTSSPSTQKKQAVQTEVMLAPQVKPEDILKDDIKMHAHSQDDFVSTTNIDQRNVSQEPQKVAEVQRQAYIEDSDQVSKESEHPVNPIVMQLPEYSIETSKIKSIVSEVSQKHQVVDVSHIDFIFREPRWIFNDHDLLIQLQHLKHLIVRLHTRIHFIHQQQSHLQPTFTWRNRLHQASKLCHANADQKKRWKFVRLIFDPGGHFLNLWSNSFRHYQAIKSPESSSFHPGRVDAGRSKTRTAGPAGSA